jgi:hypothetical protein
MNNWCNCWFFTHIFTGNLIFKGVTARRFYKSFSVKGLNSPKVFNARKRYNVFGSLVVDPIDIRTATVKNLCLFKRGTGMWNLG